MQFDKIKATKVVVSWIAGAATSITVREIIKNNVSPDKVTDKVAVAIAMWILSGVAAAVATKYTDAKIDELIADWNRIAKAREATL